MKVAAIQMPTVKDKIQNIRTAGTYIEKIKAENPDFVILPEMFCCPYQTENFPVYAEKEGGPSWQAMSDYARKYHIYLIVKGSCTESQFPMCRACSHIKCCRDENHPCTVQCHCAGKLRETDVVADHDTHFPKFSIKYCGMISRSQSI